MKTKTQFRRSVSVLLCVLLIAVIAITAFGCNSTNNDSEKPKTFKFVVEDFDSEKKEFTVTSSRKYVGDALTDENLIVCENGTFGVYVKSVTGIEHEFNNDGTYWAFYINGEYAMTYPDKTVIEDGSEYAFKAEK